MGIGSDLREAREQRGITLRDISDRTKIRQAVLRAIENDDFQGLPGSVIMRGFLKLYAREVGLDPSDVGRRYTAQVETVDDLAIQGQAGGAGSESARRLVKIAASGIVVLAMLVAGYRFCQRAPDSRSVTETARQTATEPAPSSPPPATAPAASPETARATADAATGGLRVELQATEASWVAATADGQQVVYRVVGAGERVELRVKKEAVLRIGVPTSVTVTVNGRPLKPFGRPGTPATVRITPENYRNLLIP